MLLVTSFTFRCTCAVLFYASVLQERDVDATGKNGNVDMAMGCTFYMSLQVQNHSFHTSDLKKLL